MFHLRLKLLYMHVAHIWDCILWRRIYTLHLCMYCTSILFTNLDIEFNCTTVCVLALCALLSSTTTHFNRNHVDYDIVIHSLVSSIWMQSGVFMQPFAQAISKRLCAFSVCVRNAFCTEHFDYVTVCRHSSWLILYV